MDKVGDWWLRECVLLEGPQRGKGVARTSREFAGLEDVLLDGPQGGTEAAGEGAICQLSILCCKCRVGPETRKWLWGEVGP